MLSYASCAGRRCLLLAIHAAQVEALNTKLLGAQLAKSAQDVAVRDNRCVHRLLAAGVFAAEPPHARADVPIISGGEAAC